MDIHAATASFESWLAGFGPVFAPDLAHKHEEMADADDPFPFLRGTYYRWPHHWRERCPELASAPAVLAVGDLHVENYGLWRDVEGRLCWGVNDFDEADELPYTNDLVRLATSLRVARAGGTLDGSMKRLCEAILAGYSETIAGKGDPFVLEERHRELRALAYDGDAPDKFWKKLGKAFDADWPGDVPKLPTKARAALLEDLPTGGKPEFRPRLEVGMGSLGKARYMARVLADGGFVAREVKRVTPPATAWDADTDTPSCMTELADVAIRSRDPYFRPGPEWVARRLGPRAIKLDLDRLANADDLEIVLHAMGAETANVHLGTPGAVKAVRKHLAGLPTDWLRAAAKAMAEAVEADWKAYRG